MKKIINHYDKPTTQQGGFSDFLHATGSKI
jgi:hypothetical protein